MINALQLDYNLSAGRRIMGVINRKPLENKGFQGVKNNKL